MVTSVATGALLTPRNTFTRTVAFTLFCLGLIYILHPPSHYSTAKPAQLQAVPSPTSNARLINCTLDTTHLQDLQEQYGLGDKFEYGRRHVRFHPQDVSRTSLVQVNDDLFPQGFELVDVENPLEEVKCLAPLEVPVPKSPYPTTANASDLLFGVSTTFKRLSDPETSPLKEWAHWLTDGNGHSNGGGLILRLVDANKDELKETERTMVEMGIDVKVYASDSSIEMAKRYLSLLPVLYEDNSRHKRKFLVMCDDDTFFPSMHRLVERLSTYDHSTDLYIGTFSEDVNNIQRHGSQAFGGAGVFFSLPLAQKIASLYDQCSTREKIEESNTGWGPQGDILLRKCIYENTEVRLSLLRELHQLDIQGDPSGFYEAGLAPLSLHHFKGGTWSRANAYEGVQVQHACGEDCFLQRFQTTDDFIISNGYSVAHYPLGINFNTNQVERTFSPQPDDKGWNLDFMLGPQRKSLLKTGRKLGWELQASTVEDTGVVRQTYVRMADDSRWVNQEGGRPMMEVDGVVELIWVGVGSLDSQSHDISTANS